MCGLVGVLGGRHATIEMRPLLERMAGAIRHRGPDDGGVWIDEERAIGFAHRRLSILELSPAGAQPMVSGSGALVIAFNGEIYNHLQLRAELAGSGGAPEWRGHSDTETLLACVDAWGIDRTLRAAAGMFAFALWDRRERTLTLARDRLGEKPLYYGWQGTTPHAPLLFGSELKALRQHPAFDPEIDREALTLLLRSNAVPAPHTIYRSTRKLPPGCYVTLSLAEPLADPVRYWSVDDAVRAGLDDPLDVREGEARDQLDACLTRIVGEQMLADVPVGAFLSGGIDSSLIAALMQKVSAAPAKTFSIGFPDRRHDEAVFARAVAEHLGTDHHELYVTPGQVLDVVPRLSDIYDEPHADSSQIPTLLLSALARQTVKVALSGDGGDELFAGYTRYHRADALWRRVSRYPLGARRLAGSAIRALPQRALTRLTAPFGASDLPAPPRFNGAKLHTAAGLISSESEHALYRQLVSRWPQPEGIVIGGRSPELDAAATAELPSSLHPIDRMMALDQQAYLPDEILTKVDRASMAVSLETRMPLIDHRVVELAWRLPLRFKLRDRRGKWLLREVLDRYVPRRLVERPKKGFGVPIDAWLRGPLRDWAEAQLDSARLSRDGYFQPAPLRAIWTGHLSGRLDAGHELWTVLAFQSWLERQEQSGAPHLAGVC